MLYLSLMLQSWNVGFMTNSFVSAQSFFIIYFFYRYGIVPGTMPYREEKKKRLRRNKTKLARNELVLYKSNSVTCVCLSVRVSVCHNL